METDNVCVVGAGGIGCELLKCLVMSGVNHITVIDLDTIDKSNLNRQFLFRKEHIGRPKAHVAKETVESLMPNINIQAIHANIRDQAYGTEFFRQFRLVFNALDNIEARRYVNRICLALQIPLIDAGTQGYAGQVSVHVPGETLCYECEEKPTPKSYPVCTIRSTPDKPVHCIVWAKHLFEALFGPEDNGNILSDISEQSAQILSSSSELFDTLFNKEIQIQNETSPDKQRVPIGYLDDYMPGDLDEHCIPSIPQAACLFLYATNCLISSPSRGQMLFDKDNSLIVKFITAASNLRSFNFSIEPLSIFQAKQIAGNIIPAVATTNAIAASLQVIEGLKVLQGKKDYKNSWILPFSSSNKLITSGRMLQPKPNCYACSYKISHISLSLSLTSFTLNDLVNLVLIKQLSMKEPSISFNQNILYELGEGLDEDEIQFYISRGNLTLQDIGLHTGCVIECDVRYIQDFMQAFKVRLLITHITEIDTQEYPLGFILTGNLSSPQPLQPQPGIQTNLVEDLDEVIEIQLPCKRASESIEIPTKKVKSYENVIELD